MSTAPLAGNEKRDEDPPWITSRCGRAPAGVADVAARDFVSSVGSAGGRIDASVSFHATRRTTEARWEAEREEMEASLIRNG
jgi:hypothetical protein